MKSNEIKISIYGVKASNEGAMLTKICAEAKGLVALLNQLVGVVSARSF